MSIGSQHSTPTRLLSAFFRPFSIYWKVKNWDYNILPQKYNIFLICKRFSKKISIIFYFFAKPLIFSGFAKPLIFSDFAKPWFSAILQNLYFQRFCKTLIFSDFAKPWFSLIYILPANFQSFSFSLQLGNLQLLRNHFMRIYSFRFYSIMSTNFPYFPLFHLFKTRACHFLTLFFHFSLFLNFTHSLTLYFSFIYKCFIFKYLLANFYFPSPCW